MDPNNPQTNQVPQQPIQPIGYTEQIPDLISNIPQQNPVLMQQTPNIQSGPLPSQISTAPQASPNIQTQIPNQQLPGQPPIPGPNPAAAGQPLSQAQANVNKNSTQNVLQIAEIRDGIVIMNDGSYRSVIMVKSINFDLMSPQEQEAVEYSYQGFLNSLYFPVQIFVRSQKVDLREYIEKLDKIRVEHENMLLSLLMDDYINYIDNLASQTNIMDKHFYVVVPYFPVVETITPIKSSKNMFDGIFNLFSNNKTHVVINEGALEAAKTELRNRVQAALSGLLECGIQGLPLDTQELIELYYDSYNPDTATRQQLKNFGDMNAPVITKGEGIAPQPNLEREMF